MTDNPSWRPGDLGQGQPGPPADDLAALLTQVGRGNDAAFAAVYTRISGHVFGIARSLLRDPAQAEEVAQEVLLERLARRGPFRRGPGERDGLGGDPRPPPGGGPGPLRAGRGPRASSGWPGPTSPTTSSTEAVQARLEAERVRRCLGSLTQLQQESITLAYYRGCTYREVAALLDVPVGTVKTRMRDGLIRLRDCLGVE